MTTVHGFYSMLIGLVVAAAVFIWQAMADVTDTTSQTITGRDGTADIELTMVGATSTHHLKCHMDMFRLREAVEMTTADTFCVEGTADQEPGRSQLAFEMAGLAKKGGATSSIILPVGGLSNVIQGALMKFTVSTGCFVSGNFNFTESDLIRLVNQNARIAGRGLSKGAYVYTWVRV